MSLKTAAAVMAAALALATRARRSSARADDDNLAQLRGMSREEFSRTYVLFQDDRVVGFTTPRRGGF